MDRRTLLTVLSTTALPLTGCVDGPRDALVSAAEREPDDGETALRVTDLPDAEQSIARTAIEDELYHACPELPPELRSFAGRFDGPDTAFLRYDGRTYGLWVRIGDTVWAGTAEPPEATPSCGLL
jgi:hypothetical protein